jgi:hypothetical protein
MDEAGSLLLDCFHDTGMAVPSGYHCYTRVEIQEPVAVNILDDGSATTMSYERIRSGV